MIDASIGGRDFEIREVRLYEIRVSHRTTWRLVEAETTEGLKGIGECSDTQDPDFARRYLPEAISKLADIQSLSELDDAAVVADKHDSWRETFDRRIAVGALSGALADISAQLADQPLGRALGGSEIDRLQLYANINRAPVERQPTEFVEAATHAVEDGFSYIKLAPFDGPPVSGEPVLDSGLAILRRVHSEIGDDATVLVDVHHRLPTEELPRAVKDMEDMGIGWIEDAVDVRQPDQLDWLSSLTDVALAGGEQLTSEKDFGAVCDGGWLTYLLIDPKYVGGPFRYKKILESVHDVTVTHHNPTSPVSTAMCAQIAMFTKNIGPLEFAYGEPIDRQAFVTPPENLEGDDLIVASGHGLGVELVDPLHQFAPDQVTVHTWNPSDL